MTVASRAAANPQAVRLGGFCSWRQFAAVQRSWGLSRSAAEPVTAASRAGRRIFVCGDVMTGRGIDQILPHPGDPTLREPVADARSYVTCAEQASGPIPRPADFAWPWGDALPVIDQFTPMSG